MIKNKAQVTIFIIVAIVVVAGIVLFFALRGKIGIGGVSSDFKPIEESFLSCIEDYTKAGVSMLGESGGYIYSPTFQPGSEYMPSSNYLDFVGTGIPYWYYVSGNNVAREQVPSRQEMQAQLKKYLEENLVCDFSSFKNKGYSIELSEINADVKILDDKVEVKINSNLDITKDSSSARISQHNKDVNTKLGKFYNIALKIYNYEKQYTFLEEYGLDVLNLYAPVNGVELTCSPKIWKYETVKQDLKDALEANIAMLKVKGTYYDSKKTDKYFIVNVDNDESVQFLYSQKWPTKIETLDDNGMLLARPVGNQPGLGMIGFCYVPYHFVYDMVYPVLIQIYDNNEIFRFPVVSVIKGNKAREALPGTFLGASTELCQYRNADVVVKTYDTNLEPVEANIAFKCFNEICDIGETKLKAGEAVLYGKFPQCVNGFIVVDNENYKPKIQQISTNSESEANVILDRVYSLKLSLKLDSKETSDVGVVYFEGSDYSTTVAWPDQKTAKLADGFYNITVYVYRNSTISLPETKTNKCVDMPTPGLLGVFGATTEKCFDMTVPGQTVSSVLVGGGKIQQYLTEDELKRGNLDISVSSIPLPTKIEDLQTSYDAVANKIVGLEFKS